ncbi:SRPBCC family protein [Streptomyces siamensis]|uniref:Carbon monoxide dehydrogenase n=1 Tax=Streptomyces siamensis TaxID=1274986 RepID=A0ABP9J419_9ACTN
MDLHHEFTVPVPVEEAWHVLLDIERVAPCMPGTTVEEYDGKTVTGSVKVKVGPITLTYRGSAVFEEQDEEAHRLVLVATGKETRGQGTARARVTGTLDGRADGTLVSVRTDLTVTGRPAQFGRGVMADVGDRLVGRFADCLAERLGGAQRSPSPRPAASEAGHGADAGSGVEPPAEAGRLDGPAVTARPEAEPIDLFGTAGVPVVKRLAPVAAAVVAVLVLLRIRRRVRRR